VLNITYILTIGKSGPSGPGIAKFEISPASTHKKVIVVLADKKPVRGYLNPGRLGQAIPLTYLRQRGNTLRYLSIECDRSISCASFPTSSNRNAKAFLSRPKAGRIVGEAALQRR